MQCDFTNIATCRRRKQTFKSSLNLKAFKGSINQRRQVLFIHICGPTFA